VQSGRDLISSMSGKQRRMTSLEAFLTIAARRMPRASVEIFFWVAELSVRIDDGLRRTQSAISRMTAGGDRRCRLCPSQRGSEASRDSLDRRAPLHADKTLARSEEIRDKGADALAIARSVKEGCETLEDRGDRGLVDKSRPRASYF
jgi:hypothetical protein